jgi:hypothetical protein
MVFVTIASNTSSTKVTQEGKKHVGKEDQPPQPNIVTSGKGHYPL